MKLTIEEVKVSRNFFRNRYRVFIAILWLSLGLNAGLTVVLFYSVLQIPNPIYYATNSAGAGFVTRLYALPNPNERSSPLLKPDPPEEVEIKDLNI